MAQEKSEPGQGRDNRTHRRRSVLWPAKLVVGKHRVACQIWNLSLGGARVRVDLPLKEGTKITLAVAERGDIPARVAWTRGESLGVTFEVSEDHIRTMFRDRLHILGLDEEPEA